MGLRAVIANLHEEALEPRLRVEALQLADLTSKLASTICQLCDLGQVTNHSDYHLCFYKFYSDRLPRT